MNFDHEKHKEQPFSHLGERQHELINQAKTLWRKVRRRPNHPEIQKFAEILFEIYISGVSYDRLKKMIGPSQSYICELFKRFNLTPRKCFEKTRYAGDPHRIYTIENPDFFSQIDNEEKAYWLGFLFADGNIVSRHGRPTGVRLRLAYHDKDHIELFSKCIGTHTPIKTIYSNKKKQAHLSIWNVKLAGDLSKLHIQANRGNTNLEPPALPSHLMRHFWRGVFDGDGSLQQSKRAKMPLGGISADLCGNLKTVLSYADFVKRELGYELTINRNGKSTVCFVARCHGPRALRIIELLYKNSDTGLYRKKSHAEFLIRKLEELLELGGRFATKSNGQIYLRYPPKYSEQNYAETEQAHNLRLSVS